MRNTSKMTTLENKFPLLAVEHGCIISKDADITVAFEVELPELYTVTGAEYEAIHGCWCKAIKVLPDFCVVHKQDWFIKEKYKPELQKDDMSFLSRSFERHFNERPYLKHSCYLYLTKTTKERNRMQSNFSTLCRGHIIPKELDKETAGKFMEAAEQFERIMNDSGFVRLRRLSTDELVGTDKSAGLIERYFSLMPEGDTTLQDIDLSAKEMRIGDNRLCLHTLSDAEDMPGKVATDIRYEKLSTDRSDCRLSFASPVGLLLSCNHIYNQYVIIDNSEENLQKFEKSARNMLQRCIDCYSQKIISKYIELLLDYCERFYERQFITRNEANKKIIERFDRLLDDHFNTIQSQSSDLPTIEECVRVLRLSPAYFNDLLEYETGKSYKEYLQFKRFEIAKEWLINTDKTLSQIAQELGFRNPQYFSRLFKKITGCLPNDFKMPN